MIKTLVAHTFELDDEEAAVSEILTQLDIQKNLLKNSVGVMVCYLEFMETGIVKAICNALPFDVVGINTLSSAVTGHADQMLLGLTVFTSDDVFFKAALSDTLGTEPRRAIENIYINAKNALPADPSFALVFSPVLMQLGGDALIRELDAVSGAIPLFGTLAWDYVTELRDPRIIFNGETWNDRIAIVLLAGNVEPKFAVTTVSEDRLLRQKAVITKSVENLLIEVNNMPVMRYFETLGLAKNGQFIGSYIEIPLVVDFNDGTKPVTRGIMTLLPDGQLVCGGAVPENCSLAVGNINKSDVIKTFSQAAEELLADKQDGVLLFSCAARNFVLGFDALAELQAAQEKLEGRAFMLAYSGGEICPVRTAEGMLKNRFHNISLVSCSFK